jgi:hypothetical protein
MVCLLISYNGHAIDLVNSNYSLRYYVEMKKENKKGLLSLKKMKDKFESEYGGDNIPLFFPKKTGTFVDSIYSTSLEFGEKKYTIYLDTENTPKRVKRFIKGATHNKSVMVDQKNNLPTLLFEKIPLVTIENIIIGFLTQRIKENEPMMLYEEGINQHARIYFEKDKQDTIYIDKLRCSATRYICKRTSIPEESDKNSFYVWRSSDGIPVRIVAANDKWELMIHAIGYEKIETYDIAENCKVYARDHIQELMQTTADIHISNSYFRNNQFHYQYDIAIPLKIPDPKEICVEYFIQSLSTHRTCNESYVRKNIEKDMIHFNSGHIAAYLSIDFLSCVQGDKKEQPQIMPVTVQAFIDAINSYYAQSIVYKKNSAGQFALFESNRPIDLRRASQYYLNSTQDSHSTDIKIADKAFIDNMNPEEFHDNYTKILITYSQHHEATLNDKAVRIFMSRIDPKAMCLNESLIRDALKRGRDGFQITFTSKSYLSFYKQKLETQCLNRAMPLKASLKSRHLNMAQKQCLIQGEGIYAMNQKNKKELVLKHYPDLTYLGYNSIEDKGQYVTFKYVINTIPICK